MSHFATALCSSAPQCKSCHHKHGGRGKRASLNSISVCWSTSGGESITLPLTGPAMGNKYLPEASPKSHPEVPLRTFCLLFSPFPSLIPLCVTYALFHSPSRSPTRQATERGPMQMWYTGHVSIQTHTPAHTNTLTTHTRGYKHTQGQPEIFIWGLSCQTWPMSLSSVIMAVFIFSDRPAGLGASRGAVWTWKHTPLMTSSLAEKRAHSTLTRNW